MKVKITLMHEPGEDTATACVIRTSEQTFVTLHYPECGHIVVPANDIMLRTDAYETLGSENKKHAATPVYVPPKPLTTDPPVTEQPAALAASDAPGI